MKAKIWYLATLACSAILAIFSIIFSTQCNTPPAVETPDATLTKILKDLDSTTYSLNFPPNLGLKTEYGALSDFTMIPGEAVGFNPQNTEGGAKDKQLVYVIPRRIPKWLFPPKTCPTMIPILYRDRILDLTSKLKLDLGKAVEVNGNALFVTNAATSYFSSLKADRMDKEGFVGVDASKVLVLLENTSAKEGFNRTFYGDADLTQLTAGTTSRDAAEQRVVFGPRIRIFPPVLAGCRDLINLTRLSENLMKMNPQVKYQVVQVTPSYATMSVAK